MEKKESFLRPGGRTERDQGPALGALSLVIAFSGGGTLAAGVLLPVKRGACLAWWIPMALGLAAGILLFHRLRRGGKVAQMSGTKLLYFGLAALGASGLLTGFCGLLPPLLCLPMVPWGLGTTALQMGFAPAEEALMTLARAFPEEKTRYARVQTWGAVFLLLILMGAYLAARRAGGDVLFLHLLAGAAGPALALAGAWLLDRRLCLSDQRGAELRRELGENP